MLALCHTRTSFLARLPPRVSHALHRFLLPALLAQCLILLQYLERPRLRESAARKTPPALRGRNLEDVQVRAVHAMLCCGNNTTMVQC